MPITTEQIKDLRDQTGVSIMQCKKALEEAGGDPAKALVILRKKSGEIAAKRGDRTFGAGTVQAYVHSTGNVAAMVVLMCETDFVSGNEEFKSLARDIAMHVTALNPKFLSKEDITEQDRATAKEVFLNEIKDQLQNKPKEIQQQMQDKILEGKLATYFGEMVLLDQPFIKNTEMTIQAMIDSAVQKFGEKIAIARFSRFSAIER
ncbi:MAG: elongation factor Ts [bacterium]|nr:elongation factor Ts [bacterium]